MNILVVGCGKVGRNLARTLSDKGHDVAVIDENKDRLDHLNGSFTGLLFCGIPIDSDCLVRAGIESCDVACMVTENENINIMASELVRNTYNVPIVLTLVFDSVKGEIFESCGLHTICSTVLTVDAVCSALDDYQNEQYIVYGTKKVKFYSLDVPKSYIGKKAREIDCEEGEVLFAIIRKDGSFKLLNNLNVEMLEGDELIFSKVLGVLI